jgi:hypothetical protein
VGDDVADRGIGVLTPRGAAAGLPPPGAQIGSSRFCIQPICVRSLRRAPRKPSSANHPSTVAVRNRPCLSYWTPSPAASDVTQPSYAAPFPSDHLRQR